MFMNAAEGATPVTNNNQASEREAKSADEIATFHKNMHAEILRSVGVLVSQAFELGRKYERDGTR
jgi:hypothetical protein